MDYTEGDRRRDAVLAGVLRNRRILSLMAQRAMLLAMLNRPDRTGTGSDMTVPNYQHVGNAAWLGASTNALSKQGTTRFVSFVKSQRASRKSNYIKLWVLVSDAKAHEHIQYIDERLNVLGDFDESVGIDDIESIPDNHRPPNNGGAIIPDDDEFPD